MLDSGAVLAMISVGHRSGLIDAMASLPPATSEAIAATADLAERCVREWLAVMVTGHIIEYEPVSRTYRLPAEHAACLTSGAPLGNLAVYAQHVTLIGQIQDQVLECFNSGKGMAYADYPHFHEIMAEDSGQTVGAQLFDVILPLVDGLTERLEAGIDVLDAGCARGAALLAMARRYPNSRFTGYDLCADAIAFANAAAREEGLTNIRFETRDLTAMTRKRLSIS